MNSSASSSSSQPVERQRQCWSHIMECLNAHQQRRSCGSPGEVWVFALFEPQGQGICKRCSRLVSLHVEWSTC